MNGSNELVPCTTVDDDDLAAVGKAITHALIMCIFPFEICKSSIKPCIFGGDINKTEPLTSFMAFMFKEASIIQRFRS